MTHIYICVESEIDGTGEAYLKTYFLFLIPMILIEQKYKATVMNKYLKPLIVYN